MSELDVARVCAAYGCNNGSSAGHCQRHIELSNKRPELSVANNDLSLRDCDILVSPRTGYRVVLETRAWDWEVLVQGSFMINPLNLTPQKESCSGPEYIALHIWEPERRFLGKMCGENRPVRMTSTVGFTFNIKPAHKNNTFHFVFKLEEGKPLTLIDNCL